MHSGIGLLAMKQQMGHVYLGTTMRYIHADPEGMRQENVHHAPNYLPLNSSNFQRYLSVS
jgi:hypothetical protein